MQMARRKRVKPGDSKIPPPLYSDVRLERERIRILKLKCDDKMRDMLLQFLHEDNERRELLKSGQLEF